MLKIKDNVDLVEKINEKEESTIERYIKFSPLKDETFIYPFEIYKGKLNGVIWQIQDKKYIEIKGE